MSFLYFLEGIRTPFLDSFFSLFTHLGSETAFIAIAIIVFWCVNKRDGYYLMTVGFVGTLLSQMLKLVCQVPRPWVRDPNFTIVESARGDAAGYSFPSGHTQSAVAVFGCTAKSSRSFAVRAVCIVLIIITAFSRMYLGVHTPADVGVSLVLSTVLVFAFYPLFEKSRRDQKYIYIAAGLLIALSAVYVIFSEVYTWPADIDAHNLYEGMKNGYLILGCSVAILISAWFDDNFVNFSTRAPWWAQILKVVGGLVVVLGIKAGAKPVLNALFNGHHFATCVRYFLMVIFAACVWPMTFRWFEKGCPMNRKIKKILKVLLVIVIVLLLAAAFLFWEVTRDTKDAPISTDNAENPLITPLGVTMLSGHRAGGGIYPENTMMAIENCVINGEYDLDIFEFDLHMTSDGELVLVHDSTLDRTSDAAEFFGEKNVDVGTKTLSELKKLNMGEKFENDSGEMPYAGLRGDDIPENLRIVTLPEVFTYLEANGEYRYIIEIKNEGETGFEAADKLYDTLVEFDCLDRAVVGTFHDEVTAYMDEKLPDMYRSAGMNECIEFYLYSLLNLPLPEGKFDFVALQIPTTDYTVNLGTSRMVNYAHKNNIAVQYWTINDVDEVARLQSIGADAIMTDIPDAAAKVLNQPA